MRNRALRLVRLYQKRSFDLAALDRLFGGDSGAALLDVLGGKKRVQLAAIGTGDDEQERLANGLKHLSREIELLQAERGISDLALGFPFLCGHVDADRYLQAPLLLFPVQLVRVRGKGGLAVWQIDPKRDAGTVIPNRTLLLALEKYAGIVISTEWLEELAEQVIEGATSGGPQKVTEAVSLKLQAYGITVKASERIWGTSPAAPWSAGRVVPLREYLKDEIPPTAVKTFELRPHAVLGRFPLADSALIQDFDKLLDILEVNPAQELGYAGCLVSGMPPGGARPQPPPPDERLWPVLPLDESQERVIGRILAGECLAVDGPPGTGKSQMTVNLVAAAVARRETVLVVSQKRAALDVVSQRLNEAGLSESAALVHDPIQDRRALFDRIRALMAQSTLRFASSGEPDRAPILEELEVLAAELEATHDAMTRAGSGLTPFDAYVRRVIHGAPTDAVPVRQLPPVDAAWLDHHLDDLQAYAHDQGRSRADDFALSGRRSWAGLTHDDRERLRDETLPACEEHSRRRRRWEASAPAPFAGLRETARAHPVLKALQRLCDEAPPDSSPVWVFVVDMLEATPRRVGEIQALLASAPSAGGPEWAWVPDAAAPGGADGIAALRDLTKRAPRDGSGAWAWIPRLSGPAPEGGWEEAARRDEQLVSAVLLRRASASGRVPTLSAEGWEPFEESATRLQAARARWHWVLRPGAWGDRGLVRRCLRQEGFERLDLDRDVETVRARLAHAREVNRCSRDLQVIELTADRLLVDARDVLGSALEAGHEAAAFVDAWLRLPAWCRRGGFPLSAVALRERLALAEAALRYVEQWRAQDQEVQQTAPGVPGRHGLEVLAGAALHAQALVTEWDRQMAAAPVALRLSFPGSAEAARALRPWISHGLRAKEVDDARAESEQALDPWLGSRAAGWLDSAVKEKPSVPAEQLWSDVNRHFDDLVDVDQRCDRIAKQCPGLAELAFSLRREGRSDVRPLLLAAYAERWVRDADEAPTLKALNHAHMGRLRTRLADGWDRLRCASKGAVQVRLRKRLAAAAPPPALDKEVTKQRRLLSARQLIERFWDKGLRDVVPVWLCSPETVAAVFPLRRDVFDLVVFDEASQCPLERGVTVCYRGRVTAVVGDEHQLPPSDLFTAHVVDDEAEAGLEEVPDSESLLERAKGLRGSALDQDTSLLWHYRSRYPDLIEFSNRWFYDQRLRTAPVPASPLEPPAIEWVAVNGAWERQGNAAEAKATALLLDRLLEHHPDKSVGVITFNREQASRIQDEVDKLADERAPFRARWERAMGRSLDERPFVRNLENVQGDERDIILLSVAYAPGRSGVLSRNFGILSQQGGERRLNVAISRARWKMAVLCSFSPELHFSEEGITSEGGKLLRRFLVFARGRGGGALADGLPRETNRGMDPAAGGTSADLARSVSAALGELGYGCHANVGSSSCRVDLAVFEARSPGRYLIGVLFDGPCADWAGDARSRELGRWSFLQSYGWRLFGLSARSWLRERDVVVRALRGALDEAVRSPESWQQPVALDPLLPRELVATRVPTPGTGAPQETGGAPGGPPVERRSQEPPPGVSAGGRGMAAGPIRFVGPGSVVVYRKVGDGATRTVCIGAKRPDAIEISAATPVARALNGAAAGDFVSLSIGDVDHELEVLSVDGAGSA